MDSLLAQPLAQISQSASNITSLHFAPPKIFTNAILHSTNIVSLLRDSDVQERALFTMPTATRAGTAERKQRQNTAVQNVLGGDMIAQLRRGGAGGHGSAMGHPAQGDVDVELLLMGAEKLVSVFHIPGASRRIATARQRFEQLSESIVIYEALVEAQRKQLDILNAGVEDAEEEEPAPQQEQDFITDEMLEQEEEAIRQLEQRREQMELKIKNLDRQMSSVYRNV